jgi:3-deoxy-D-manno-octulosonate 8-phosphate phosphatase (KDO 8-P phosphatase)
MINTDLRHKIRAIKCLAVDVDGVLTDGKIYISSHGEEMRAFHVQDGLGIHQLLQAGIEVAVISSRNSPLVTHRMQELGVKHVFQGEKNKLVAFEALLKKLNLPAAAIAFVGDDLPDIPVMQQAGMAIAVANAVNAVKQIAHWQTTCRGGEGAIREICDIILTS